MENLKVIIRKPGATGLEFQAGLYIERGNCHDLVAEVYSIERANRLSAFPDLLKALEAIEWVLTPGGQEWDSSQYECPWCDFCREQGHDSICQRQVAIAKARGEQ